MTTKHHNLLTLCLKRNLYKSQLHSNNCINYMIKSICEIFFIDNKCAFFKTQSVHSPIKKRFIIKSIKAY